VAQAHHDADHFRSEVSTHEEEATRARRALRAEAIEADQARRALLAEERAVDVLVEQHAENAKADEARFEGELAAVRSELAASLAGARAAPAPPVPGAAAGPASHPAVRGDDDDGDDDDETRRRRIKEKDVIDLPALPSVPQFQEWRAMVRDAIMAASGRGDELLPWVLEIQKADTTIDMLADPGPKYRSLDQKLKEAVNKIATPALRKEITYRGEEQVRFGRTLKGRQALWIVYSNYKTDRHLGQVYGLRDLGNVRLHDGGSNLEKFYLEWNHVLAGCSDPPPKSTIEALLLEQLRKAPNQLGYDLGTYDRAAPGSAERSYDFLMSCVVRCIELHKQTLNRKEMEKVGNRAAAPAAGASGSGGTPQCRHFASGSCAYGDRCRFAHGDKQPKGSGARGSRSKSRGGKGKGRAAIAPPPQARQERALAGPNPRGRRAAPAASGDKKLYPCFRFQRGECKNGAGCEYAHRRMTPDEEKRYNQRDRSPSRGGSPRGSPRGRGRR
jgi:hypothetical protein